MTKLADSSVTREVDLGRGPVYVTLQTLHDVPMISFREKGSRKESWTVTLSSVYVRAVGAALEASQSQRQKRR